MLYPLRFHPIFRHYVWGGSRLAELLGKNIPGGQTCAESWEIVDHGRDQSIVAEGPLRGMSLHQLVTNMGLELLGRHHPQPQFPLLFKFLDANQNLSVQVHPNDAQAARLDPPGLGKTEAWVVLDAQPGRFIYAGLKRGFDRFAFQREVQRGTTELCLHRFQPQVDDYVFLPAGIVHALGKGLMVAEIQQASDTTYRLYDWNRVGTDGKPRPLHISQALETIDYDLGPVDPGQPQPTGVPGKVLLVSCDKFVLNRWQLDRPTRTEKDERARILAVLSGNLQVPGDAASGPLAKGDTILVPAVLSGAQLVPEPAAEFLEIHLP